MRRLRRSGTYARAVRYAVTQTALVCTVACWKSARGRVARSAYGWGTLWALAISISLLAGAIAFRPSTHHQPVAGWGAIPLNRATMVLIPLANGPIQGRTMPLLAGISITTTQIGNTIPQENVLSVPTGAAN
jgi:hypothetical protein